MKSVTMKICFEICNTLDCNNNSKNQKFKNKDKFVYYKAETMIAFQNVRTIKTEREPGKSNNQNGFRPGRSTTAQNLALQRLIEGVKRNNLKASIVFIDLSKAVDSVHRGNMLRILKAYGIPERLVQAISKMHKRTIAKVLPPDD